jgi:hypothetical protein
MDTRAEEPWVCVYCQGGAHTHCLGPVCECLHEKEAWLTPTRRAQLRTGVIPANARETEFQTAYFAHRADRAAAEERRA